MVLLVRRLEAAESLFQFLRPGCDFFLEFLLVIDHAVVVFLHLQEGFDAGAYLRLVHGFVEEFVGARLEGAHPVLDLGEGRHHDDRDARPVGARLDPPRHLETVQPRHHGVQKYQVRRVGFDGFQGFRPVFGELHVIALAHEHGFHDLQILGVVVDYENEGLVAHRDSGRFRGQEFRQASGGLAIGMEKVKLVPFPSPSLASQTRPPWSSTMRFVRLSPRPVPATHFWCSPRTW